MNQNQSQNPNSILLGSAIVEIAHQADQWVNLGLIHSLSIQIQGQKISVKSDNGQTPFSGLVNRTALLEFQLLERYLPNLAQIYKGVNTIVMNPSQSCVKNWDIPKLLPNQFYCFPDYNFDHTQPSKISVSEGSTTIDPSDYCVVEFSGHYGLVFLDSLKGKSLSVQYTITPVASYHMNLQGSGLLTPLSMRLTNFRCVDGGKTLKRVITLFQGYLNCDDQIQFKSNSDSNPVASIPLKFIFYPDLSRDDQAILSEMHEMLGDENHSEKKEQQAAE